MAAFYLRLTALGLAAVATAIAEGSPLPLVDFALGDGGGATYDPTGAETDLVNEVARVPIETVARDPAQADRVTVTAVVPAEEGGFWVRELGVFTEAGDLFAIGKYPEAYKPTIAEGASYDLQVAASMTIAAAADVTVSELSGDFYATRDWARANADFFAVISASLTAPPAAPTAGDQYLIPAGAAGAWAAQAGKVAHWRGEIEGWQFLGPRRGAMALEAETRTIYRRDLAGWRQMTATVAEHQAGLDETLFATPFGVANMITGFTTRDWARANADFFAVISASLAAPPAAPTAGDQYLIPAGAAGAWEGQAGKVAHWRGEIESWQLIAPRTGSFAIDAATGIIYRRGVGAWRRVAATEAEHQAGTDDTVFATPLGVAQMIAARRPVAARLFNFRNFT